MATQLGDMGVDDFLKAAPRFPFPERISCEASFSGAIAFFSVERSAVEALLPPNLELASRRGNGGHHPLVVTFGNVYSASPALGGFRSPATLDYKEVAFAVPFVTRGGGGCLYNFIPRMFADSFWPNWFGNTYYGFAKRPALLRWRAHTLEVAIDGSAESMRISIGDGEPWSHQLTGHGSEFRSMRKNVYAAAARTPFGWRIREELVWVGLSLCKSAGRQCRAVRASR